MMKIDCTSYNKGQASMTIKNYYNKNYFIWQKTVGEFGGWANITKFQLFIKPNDNVLDFGCGGGYLLKNLDCKDRVGIDINSVARKEAARNKLVAYETIDEVNDNWADVIISNNSLEHCSYPLEILKKLYDKLKPGGKIILVTSCESIGYRYNLSDINMHLYSWSPQCLGNLFIKAGYIVDEVKPYIHKWPPAYKIIARIGGRYFFDICARIWGHLERSWFQVRIVAHK